MTHLYEIARNRSLDGLQFLGIDFTPGIPNEAFWAWEGVGYHTHAARLSPAEILKSWQDHIRLSNAEWLIPLLEKFVAADSIDAKLVLATYLMHHGHDAPHREAGNV